MPDEPASRTTTAREFRELVSESPARATDLAESSHPADVVAWFADLVAEDAWRVFASLSTEARAAVLEYADEALRARIVPHLTASELARIVGELPSDEAVDVLAKADERVSEDVLGSMNERRAGELRELSAWPDGTAGGAMTLDHVAVPPGTRLGDAMELIQGGASPTESIGLFVVDDERRPVGYLADRDLLTHPVHAIVDDVMRAPVTIGADRSWRKAAELIAKYGSLPLAVVDAEGRLAGVISPEDAQDLYDREVGEDILRIAGAAPAHQPTRLPISSRVRRRLPVMLVTVLGGLVSARLIGLVLPEEVGAGSGAAAVLRYIPIVIGLAGNVGIQSSTILVRAFATGEVAPERELSVLRAEVVIGAILGAICGAASAGVATWFESGAVWLGETHPLVFGTVLGAAIALAVTWSSMLGCVIPMLCRRVGIDPAIVAGPFLICLSDISGSAIYVLVATAALAELMV